MCESVNYITNGALSPPKKVQIQDVYLKTLRLQRTVEVEPGGRQHPNYLEDLKRNLEYSLRKDISKLYHGSVEVLDHNHGRWLKASVDIPYVNCELTRKDESNKQASKIASLYQTIENSTQTIVELKNNLIDSNKKIDEIGTRLKDYNSWSLWDKIKYLIVGGVV